MDIASCSRHFWMHPRSNIRPTCSRDIPGVYSVNVFCRSSPRRCSAVLTLRRFLASKRRRMQFDTSQLQCFSVSTVHGDSAETSDCTGELRSQAFRPEEVMQHGKGPVNSAQIDDGENDSKSQTDYKMIKICDNLIEIFMVDKPTSTDWRRLLAFSKEWANIRPHFFKRCQERADLESNPEMKHNLFRLGRKLKEVDDDVQRHDELIYVVKGASDEINSIVAKRRKDFTKDFFFHLHAVVESYFDNPTEQNALAKLANDCLAAVQRYDNASESITAVEAAKLKLHDIINSSSVAAACKKIDDLAEKKQLDSALMLVLTKAWSAAKESNMMKDEAKDMLYHLYMTAVGNLQRLVPKEIRILKFLLTIDDPKEQISALNDAFTPGPELERKDADCLYTTPEQLHTCVRTVVDSYHFSKEGTLINEARDLMNPKIIQKLENLKKLIKDHFL